jgi:hypothetical protein
VARKLHPGHDEKLPPFEEGGDIQPLGDAYPPDSALEALLAGEYDSVAFADVRESEKVDDLERHWLHSVREEARVRVMVCALYCTIAVTNIGESRA